MKQVLRIISGLPLGFVILFDAAALMALAFAMTLMSKPADERAAVRASPSEGGKRIAISFDDAPRDAGAFLSPDLRSQMLIAALSRAGVKQAVFFINPGRIEGRSKIAESLRAYARAGHLLANHTADHSILSQVSAERFLADVDAAETWLRPEPGYRPWFRFPELDAGKRDASKRDAVRAGLKTRGLREGYATADGWDWYLDSLASKASRAGSPIDLDALRDLYVQTHVEAVDFADGLAQRTLGRAPAEILLLHETDLAALYLEDLIAALRADGWTIITADEAYADPLAKLPPPDIASADGTLIQMWAWQNRPPGPRWDQSIGREPLSDLFRTRVLHLGCVSNADKNKICGSQP